MDEETAESTGWRPAGILLSAWQREEMLSQEAALPMSECNSESLFYPPKKQPRLWLCQGTH